MIIKKFLSIFAVLSVCLFLSSCNNVEKIKQVELIEELSQNDLIQREKESSARALSDSLAESLGVNTIETDYQDLNVIPADVQLELSDVINYVEQQMSTKYYIHNEIISEGLLRSLLLEISEYARNFTRAKIDYIGYDVGTKRYFVEVTYDTSVNGNISGYGFPLDNSGVVNMGYSYGTKPATLKIKFILLPANYLEGYKFIVESAYMLEYKIQETHNIQKIDPVYFIDSFKSSLDTFIYRLDRTRTNKDIKGLSNLYDTYAGYSEYYNVIFNSNYNNYTSTIQEYLTRKNDLIILEVQEKEINRAKDLNMTAATYLNTLLYFLRYDSNLKDFKIIGSITESSRILEEPKIMDTSRVSKERLADIELMFSESEFTQDVKKEINKILAKLDEGYAKKDASILASTVDSTLSLTSKERITGVFNRFLNLGKYEKYTVVADWIYCTSYTASVKTRELFKVENGSSIEVTATYNFNSFNNKWQISEINILDVQTITDDQVIKIEKEMQSSAVQDKVEKNTVEESKTK